ncbi:MAG: hypothetical protein NWE87_06145 [Candidatus Bathyarchaeota archaeon]|nr:hypothetical protein [Candidatus Bathyarchaeota archaeon]
MYENLIVFDENGTFLDYSLDAPIIVVDSLGARSIRLEWDALDLTNKTSGIWALTIDAPITFKVTFPKNTTILDLSEIPLEIMFLDPAILIMPSNLQTISYVVGTITPKERARETLDTVAAIINNIKASGVNTAAAEALLLKAETAFSTGNYMLAETLANEALEKAYELQEETQSFPTHLLILVLGSVIIIAISLFLVRRVRGGKVDVEEVLKGYPWLRSDQQEIIRFLAEKKDGIFESDLRQAFDIPKSSMWRLIKRLEDEEIVTVTQLRGQNYIKLKKQKR